MSTTEPLKPAIDRARLEFSKDLAQEIQRIEEEHGDEYGCNASGLASLLLPFIESRRPAAAHAPMEGEAPTHEIDYSRECDQCGRNPWKSWASWQCAVNFGSCDGVLRPVPARPEVEGETPECDTLRSLIEEGRIRGGSTHDESIDWEEKARSLERRLRSPGTGAWQPPKVWDAETIKDAPEGLYFDAPLYTKQAAENRLSQMPSEYKRFIGPIPQPPATTTTDALNKEKA